MSFYHHYLLEEDYYPVVRFYYYKEWRDFKMPVHSHEAIEIMYVLSGHCLIEVDGQMLKLKKGQFIFIDGNIPHRLQVEPGKTCRMSNIEFNFQQLQTVFPPFKDIVSEHNPLKLLTENPHSYLLFHDSCDISQCMHALILELDRKETNSVFTQQLLLSQILIRMAELAAQEQDTPEQNVYIQKSIEYMHRNYDRDIRVKDVADAVHLHPGYLHRIFKKSMGTSVNGYLINHRMDKAKELLTRTNITITDIPHYIGMNSQQYFSTIFRQQTGTTPKQYRKESRFRDYTETTGEHFIHSVNQR
ncbi:AraC family transcriptional regulator [Alkalicoccobacillus murimartini]|uniref:YesN/AraC family two-component response regulator n=1 Tax=Alkalicoccobacillus murimartini TaxID=171685 RepID=A0ABT9YH83_9BACI|nr:AraC family transcriptional regulator [Alkalicoccobacillus murimartini]MDQ0206547.1 YesN/AraC family two-component response regulator [Alkalicoccobacillus murimartini]